MTKIWSIRFSIARGNHYVLERECSVSDAQEWLKIFREDEPNVIFLASFRKPRLSK